MAKKVVRRGEGGEAVGSGGPGAVTPVTNPLAARDTADPRTPTAPTPTVVEAEVAHPATDKQKITLAVLLLLWTIVSLFLAGMALERLQAVTMADITVEWRRESEVKLTPGPVGFRYIRSNDCKAESDQLVIMGPMSDEMRLKLVALFPAATAIPPEDATRYEKDVKSYLAAIDDLATASIRLINQNILALLLLGGCCGMVGVQLRSMWDFVRNVCFKEPPQLDVVTWWPWYVMRPLIGFVLGMLAISMIMSGFLEIDNQNPRSNVWWLSITALVGFGASEFMSRLRLVVAALFATQG
ncbi:MAG: hypothetical protein H6822_20745 [Planctomycetaceae bacterium]|nr:hypothetical protein [Planctomycetales bacterium]MCB9924620.1 hypothetical protein [Planctomycetaceae bacterium]